MTTQSPIPEYREFALQIAGVSERVKAGRAVKIVEGPARPGMQFPDTFDCADPGLFQYLTVGANVKLVLKRSKSPKKKKDGAQYDGSLDWMWWWDVIGVDGHGGTGSVIPHATPAPQPAQAPAPRQMPRMDDETTRRITFLSALNAAATYHGPAEAVDRAAVIVTATAFADAAFAYGRGEAVDPFDMFPAPETPVEAAPAPTPVSTTAQAPQPSSASPVDASKPQNAPSASSAAAGLAKATADRGWTPEQIKAALGGRTMRESWNAMAAQGVSEAMCAKNIWMSLVGKLG